jgi:hypothetical protein
MSFDFLASATFWSAIAAIATFIAAAIALWVGTLPARLDRERQIVIRNRLLPPVLDELRELKRALGVDGDEMAQMMVPYVADGAPAHEGFRLRYFIAPLNALKPAVQYTHIFEPELAAALLSVEARMQRLIRLRDAIAGGTPNQADARDEVRIAWNGLMAAVTRVLEIAEPPPRS